MVKKFLKTNNNFVWSLGVIGIVLLFLYVGARREGFQNTPASGPSIPSMSPIPPIPPMPSMPPMSSMLSMPPRPSTPSMPPMSSMPPISSTPPMPSPLTNPKPSISTVRTKLNELKTMVDSM